MEVDGESTVVAPSSSSPLSLPIFAVIRAAQAAHGLRYSDYARYRSFCSKKLRRLSCSLKLNAQTQRGKFVKRKIEPEATTEVGQLSLLLTSAERAWSRAQEAKLALESGPDMSKKRVLLSRSSKAAFWGRELAAAAVAAGDSRTAVEAAAYSAWLDGLAAMERAPGAGKQGGDGSSIVDVEASAAAWSSALEALARAGELCSRLAASSAGFEPESSSDVSPADARAAARAQAADVAPLVRFCQHQLGRAKAPSSSPSSSDPERIAAAAAEGAGAAAGPKMKAALEELRAGEGKDVDDDDDATINKERPSSSSASPSTFSWRGGSFSVPSERARSALAAAQAALAEARKVEGDAAARLAALDRALVAFGDAKGIVRQQQQAGGAGGGATAAAAASSSSSADAARAAANARSLALAVTGAALDAALERGRLAASLLSRALDGGEEEAAMILKVKEAALLVSAEAAAAEAATETTTTTSSSAAALTEKKKKQQRRRAAAAVKCPTKPEDAVRAYTSLAKTAKQLGEVAAALGGTTGELLLDEAAALGADASARRTFWAARAFLASRRCPDAMALLDRARERARAAVEAHEECSRPDGAAISALRSLAEDACPGWRAVAHAEAAAKTARGVRAAGAKVAGLKVASGKKKRRSEDDDEDGDDEEEEEQRQQRAPKRPFLMDRLDDWASCAPAMIAPIPPRLETVPVRPFVLDVAFDGVVPPDISRRVGKAATARSASASSSAAAAARPSSASAATGASEEESAGTLSKLAGAFGWGSK